MDLEPRLQDEEIEINMSPMIDMVFLLLIFFLVSAKIVDTKVPVKLPSAVYAKAPEDTTGRIEISVQKNGNMFVAKHPVSLAEFKGILSSELKQNPNLQVQIRADGRVKYKIDEKIMEACADVGANDLIFSAYEK